MRKKNIYGDTTFYLKSDITFMYRFRQGEQQAFKQLWDHVFYQLAGYIYKIVAVCVQDPSTVDDIIAHAFYQLFYQREKMETLDHIRRFLFMVSKNKAIDYLREWKRKGIQYMDFSNMAEDFTEESNIQGEKHWDEKTRALFEAIEKLPRMRKIILRKYFIENKSTQEIADELHLDDQTIRNQKVSALKMLKLWLTPLYEQMA